MEWLPAVPSKIYVGIIFKNTAPIPEQSSVGSPLAGTSPDDEGVDITGIIGLAKGKWKHLI